MPSDYLSALAQAHWPPDFGPPPATWHWLLQANGALAAHNNLLLFGFPDNRQEPALVAKICRTPRYDHTLRREYVRLGELWQKWGADARGRAPRPLTLAQHGADVVLLMSYCGGAPLLTALTRFWQDAAQIQTLLQQAAIWLHDLHHHTATPKSGAEMGADFAASAAAFADLFSLSEAEQEVLTALSEQVARAETAASARALLQGDFWPGNVIRSPAPGGALDLILVDWQFSRWDSNVSLDVYLFLAVCATKASPYDAAHATRARLAAQTLLDWRTHLLPAYLAAYAPPPGCRLLPARAGLLACCVEMAARPFLAFGLTQADAVHWRTLFGELHQHFMM